MKEKIAKLKLSGQVFIWKYLDNSRNYPDWNLTLDKIASKELSNLLDMMNQCDWGVSKSFKTSKPTETELLVPNNQNGHAKWITKDFITFCSNNNIASDYWKIKESSNSLELNFGKEMLMKLKEAITNIPLGKGDISISDKNENNILTFWWNLQK